MNFHGKDIKIFAGNSNMDLAKAIALNLKLPLGKVEVKSFSDGEVSVSLHESVRGSDCFIVQSTCNPVNKNLMELLIMMDAMKRASASRITAVIPYFGYARQDRKSKARDPISAKLVADLITTAGADRVLTMDLHTPQIQGFFNIPVDNLTGAPLLASSVKNNIKNNTNNYVVVSPDFGSVNRAKNFAAILDLPMAIINKRRPCDNISEVMGIIGDVKGKNVILFDDIIDTAGTICNAALATMDSGGAKSVVACVTHAVLSGQAIKNLESSLIEKLYFLDTIPIHKSSVLNGLNVISVASLFAQAISRIHKDEPVSTLFV